MKHYLILCLGAIFALSAPAQQHLRKALEETIRQSEHIVDSDIQSSGHSEKDSFPYAFEVYKLRIEKKAARHVQRWNDAYEKERLAATGRSNVLLRRRTQGEERFSIAYSLNHPFLVMGEEGDNLLLVLGAHPSRQEDEVICAVNWRISEDVLEGKIVIVERKQGVKARSEKKASRWNMIFPNASAAESWKKWGEKGFPAFPYRGEINEEELKKQLEQAEKVLKDAKSFKISPEDKKAIEDAEKQLKEYMRRFPKNGENIEVFPHSSLGGGGYLREQFEGYSRVAIEDWLRRLSFYKQQFETTADEHTRYSIRLRSAEGISLLPVMKSEDLRRAYDLVEELYVKDGGDSLNSRMSPSFLQTLSAINHAANLRDVSDYDQKAYAIHLPSKVSGMLQIIDENGKKHTWECNREEGRFEVEPREDAAYDVSVKKHLTPFKEGMQLEVRKYADSNGVFLKKNEKTYQNTLIDGACDEFLPFVSVRYVSVGNMKAPSKEIMVLSFDDDCSLYYPGEGHPDAKKLTIVEGSCLIFETENVH